MRVDAAVSKAVLDAVAPAGIEAALRAWEELTDEGDEKARALELAAEKARYEAERARRQYDAVDPENRLVADELERRWNDRLQQQREIEERLNAARQSRPSVGEQEREHLLELGDDLPKLWSLATTPAALKKRILRTVLEEVVVDVDDERSRLVIQLHWAGGVHTALTIAKNRPGRHRRCTDQNALALVQELSRVSDDQNIAALLNRLGFRTGTGKTWTLTRVRSLRSTHKIPVHDRSQRTWVTANDAASALGVGVGVVRRLLKSGILPGRQVIEGAPWVIERENLDVPEVQTAIRAVRHGRRIPVNELTQEAIRFKSTK